MFRYLYIALGCLVCTTTLYAQTSGPAAPPRERQDAPRAISLSLEPAPEPRPALKYQLQHEVIDQIPGNAALAYHSALTQFVEQKDGDDTLEPVRDWLDVPLEELPVGEVRDVVRRFDAALRTATLAARYEQCDWQLPVREEGYALMLPHLGTVRDLARVLALRSRLNIVEGRYDDALADLRTGLSLARHVGDSATLIEGLVGIATASIMLDRVEELIDAPRSPNLYWALTELTAAPLFSFQKAMQWEKSLLYVHAPALKDLDRDSITTEQFQQIVGEVQTLSDMTGSGLQVRRDRNQTVATGLALAVYPRARRSLQEQGLEAAKVDAMPVAEIVTRYLLGKYEEHRDNAIKWAAVPFPRAHRGLAEAEAALQQGVADDPVGNFLPGLLLPAIARASARFAEVDRRLAALRCIEALRLNASATGGDLPNALVEITIVPVPDDALTGRPFRYENTAGGARLELPALPGDRPNRGRIYELTLQN